MDAKFVLITFFFYFIICGTLLLGAIVNSTGASESNKPVLCQRPPKWSIDENGQSTDNGTIVPMDEARGNVTVIALLKGATNHAIQQAEGIKVLASVFESSGLSDIKLFIVNSRETSSVQALARLKGKVNGSNIQIIQETDQGHIWSLLGGHRGDTFIYDRCGRLSYHIPNPLSVMVSSKPIVQTTILSAYFDKPCGVSCDDAAPQEPPALALDEVMESGNEGTFNESTSNSTWTGPPEEETGRSDGDSASETLFQPWKIFEFFLNQIRRPVAPTTTMSPASSSRVTESTSPLMDWSVASVTMNSSTLASSSTDGPGEKEPVSNGLPGESVIESTSEKSITVTSSTFLLTHVSNNSLAIEGTTVQSNLPLIESVTNPPPATTTAVMTSHLNRGRSGGHSSNLRNDDSSSIVTAMENATAVEVTFTIPLEPRTHITWTQSFTNEFTSQSSNVDDTENITAMTSQSSPLPEQIISPTPLISVKASTMTSEVEATSESVDSSPVPSSSPSPSLLFSSASSSSSSSSSPSSSPAAAVAVECDASRCVDFSTDKILRARLCCLKEDDFASDSPSSSKTGCHSFTRTTCSQMLPLIKCCLKDFKELLAQYFNSQRSARNSSVRSNNLLS